MTTEESALQVDWRSTFQESYALADQSTRRAFSPDSPTAGNEPKTSAMGLSAVLIIILGGIATTFAAAAIIVFLTTHG